MKPFHFRTAVCVAFRDFSGSDHIAGLLRKINFFGIGDRGTSNLSLSESWFSAGARATEASAPLADLAHGALLLAVCGLMIPGFEIAMASPG